MSEPHSSLTVPNQSDPSQLGTALEDCQVSIVEDSPDRQRLYLTFLQRARAEVTLACNGQSALKTVEKSPHTFDAVIMDLEMPGMDGIQTTWQLRQRGDDGAIIAATAVGSNEKQQSWFRAGCDAYLVKPVDEQTLVSSVRQHSTAAT